MNLVRFFIVIILIVLPFSAYADMADMPLVKLQALDKSTARTTTLKVRVGTTIEYGSLFIKVQACRKSDPLDKPEDAAFIQVWEVPIGKEKSEWAFSGWMFSSSPALSAMDHAVYDVWVLECLTDAKAAAKQVEEKVANDEAPETVVEIVEEEVEDTPITRTKAENFYNIINEIAE